MINIEAIGKNFIIRGRKQNGERYEQRITDFQPYFYALEQNGTFKSIFGEPAKKIIVKHPADVRKERENYKSTFEADVTYVNRLLIDRYDSIPQEPIRACFIDIEVDDESGFANVKTTEKKILAIAAYDTFSSKYYQFALSPNINEKTNEVKIKTQFKDMECATFIFNQEHLLLRKFVEFINKFDFDLFFAWNGDNFDYPYLFGRMKKLGIELESLSPIEQVNDVGQPRCRVWLDQMWAYRKLSTTEQESMKLDYIANKEIGVGKLTLEKGITETWRNQFDIFLNYNLFDVFLMVKIEEAKGILQYFDTIRRFAFCNWSDVKYNSRVLDFYFLKKARMFGIVLPTKEKKEEIETIEGARVIDPVPGIHNRIGVGDVRSLYPTAILTCNMSPETLITTQISQVEIEELQVPIAIVEGHRYLLDERGFVPLVVEDLWNLRQKFKNEMKKHPVDSKEYKKWDAIQTVCKFLLNSIYGVMLAPHFRLHKREIGQSITAFGRRANIWMEKKVIEQGYKVIAGDTDSIFFEIDPECKLSVDEVYNTGKTIIENVNKTLDDFCIDEFGTSKYNKMFVEFDKVYKRVLFLKGDNDEAIKKRYAGWLMFSDDKYIEDKIVLDIKGFENKRSDTPKIIRDLQYKILGSILGGSNNDEIVSLIANVKSKILKGEYTPEIIAIPKGMSKEIKDYKANVPIHVRGAKYFNDYCGGNIKQEKVKYIYVKNVPVGLPDTYVISFIDKMPVGFTPDWDKMAKLLIDDKFIKILTSAGIDINSIERKSEYW